jgi:hypothetical protein
MVDERPRSDRPRRTYFATLARIRDEFNFGGPVSVRTVNTRRNFG